MNKIIRKTAIHAWLGFLSIGAAVLNQKNEYMEYRTEFLGMTEHKQNEEINRVLGF